MYKNEQKFDQYESKRFVHQQAQADAEFTIYDKQENDWEANQGKLSQSLH